MNSKLYGLIISTAMLLLTGSAAGAAECSGPWQVDPNYRPGSGGACAVMGLNTHQAVCQPGQRYATYCDDASGGRYRTCSSTIPCFSRSRDYRDHHEYGPPDWNTYHNRRDFRQHRPEPDNRHRDWRGTDPESRWHERQSTGWERYRHERGQYRTKQPLCTRWDYTRNQPCPEGTINRDCRNGCGGLVNG